MGRVNADEMEWTTLEEGETFFKRKQLGDAAGGERIGCSLYEIPAGRRSWPYHYHTGNEEAIFVLDGRGTLRLDGESMPLAPGDYVALPGNERGAHRVVNDSDGALRYLMPSTMDEPDVTVYPDTGKIGVFVGAAPGGRGERSLQGYYQTDDTVDYWTNDGSTD
ncbi:MULTISPECIES: cupin domain-containing protein [Halostella]|uniref:cupin domain-containing protein n=1 Tax=Halostella TaxID=1843185 RepID=UPI001080D7DC|nr:MULTISPECIES: cupin domain-containing protein [Halostella]